MGPFEERKVSKQAKIQVIAKVGWTIWNPWEDWSKCIQGRPSRRLWGIHHLQCGWFKPILWRRWGVAEFEVKLQSSRGKWWGPSWTSSKYATSKPTHPFKPQGSQKHSCLGQGNRGALGQNLADSTGNCPDFVHLLGLEGFGMIDCFTPSL